MAEQPGMIGRKFTLRGEDLPSPLEIRVVDDGRGGVDAYGSSNYDGFEYEFWGKTALVNADDPIMEKCHASFDDGNMAIVIFWGGGRVTKEGNPVVLEFFHSPETGSDYSMLHVDKASNAELEEMKVRRHFVERSLRFKQAQRGGRKQGSRSKKTEKVYRRIMNNRNSGKGQTMTDPEFRKWYERTYGDPLSQSRLTSAKRWWKEGNR